MSSILTSNIAGFGVRYLMLSNYVDGVMKKHLTLRETTAFLFLCSAMTFPRSYVFLKLTFLAVFLIANIKTIIAPRTFLLDKYVFFFYMSIAVIGLLGSLIGFINGGYLMGIMGAFRLYVVWSVVFFIIFTLFLQGNSFLVFHKAIVVSGILISAINFFALYDYMGQFGFLSEDLIEEMKMYIGIHDGYVQFTSHNIGSLFFIIAYLIAVQFRKDMATLNGKLTKFSLFVCLILAALSGRRALWVVLFLTPLLILFLSMICSSLRWLKGRRFLLPIFIGGCILLVGFGIAISGIEQLDNSTISHLFAAFSSDDERSIQKVYLIEGFANYPIFGSGFGAYAGYVRSEESPWLYELTYHQLFFNLGIVGILFLLALTAFYFYRAVIFISRGGPNSGVAFGMLIGLSVFAMGAYSNPYFGSFDFLLFIGVLPLISASLVKSSQKMNVISGATH